MGHSLHRTNQWKIDDFEGALLENVDLRCANLLCQGNSVHIKTLKIDTWHIVYTATELQIDDQLHGIDVWRGFDSKARGGPIRHSLRRIGIRLEELVPLVLSIIDVNPAEPTGSKKPEGLK